MASIARKLVGGEVWRQGCGLHCLQASGWGGLETRLWPPARKLVGGEVWRQACGSIACKLVGGEVWRQGCGLHCLQASGWGGFGDKAVASIARKLVGEEVWRQGCGLHCLQASGWGGLETRLWPPLLAS